MRMCSIFTISIAFLVVFIISVCIINAKHEDKRFKKIKLIFRKKKKCRMSSYVSYSTIRNQYFDLDDMKDTTSCITEYIYEAFNIFLKLSPSVISTITKADKRLLMLKTLSEKEDSTQEALSIELDNINSLLDRLIEVSHEMIKRLEEILENPDDNLRTLELSPESVKTYMESVNLLNDLVSNHSGINYDIHYIFYSEYPDLVDKFRIVSGKITYVLFVFLISYSIKIDENTYLYY